MAWACSLVSFTRMPILPCEGSKSTGKPWLRMRSLAVGPMEAIVFFIAASILVLAAELIIRPYIVYARSSIHPMLVLLAFLGGGLVAGVFGFFLAPAMLGVISAIFQMLKKELGGLKEKMQGEC